MKNRIVFLSIFLHLLFASNTTEAQKFDIHGKLKTPDLVALNMGLKLEEDGYTDSALEHFIQSAKFGNNDAKYIVAMYHFSNKNWPEGYAWLHLMNAVSEEQKEQISAIQQLISDDEKKQAAVLYQSLKKEYSPLSNLMYRKRWASSGDRTSRRSIKSPIRSVNSYGPTMVASFSLVDRSPRQLGEEFIVETTLSAAADPATIIPTEKLSNQIEEYIFEFENNVGNVVLDDLELVEPEDEK